MQPAIISCEWERVATYSTVLQYINAVQCCTTTHQCSAVLYGTVKCWILNAPTAAKHLVAPTVRFSCIQGRGVHFRLEQTITEQQPFGLPTPDPPGHRSPLAWPVRNKQHPKVVPTRLKSSSSNPERLPSAIVMHPIEPQVATTALRQALGLYYRVGGSLFISMRTLTALKSLEFTIIMFHSSHFDWIPQYCL